MVEKVLLASPRGYCAGVERAVETVERALDLYGPPVYVRKQIVHNLHVVRDLEARGASSSRTRARCPRARRWSSRPTVSRRRFTLEAADAEAPDDRRDLPARDEGARPGAALRRRRLHRDPDRPRRATRRSSGRWARAPDSIVLVESHRRRRQALEFPEGRKLAYVTQTTLSVDETGETIAALRRRFPSIYAPKKEDICYATSNRQWAVKEMLAEIELLLVIGSRNSSNSNRLVETARSGGVAAHLIDDESRDRRELARRRRRSSA